MALILENRRLAEDAYLMKVAGLSGGPGQFYMLRPDNGELFLGRPISIMYSDEQGADFLYQVVGKGTRLMAQLTAGQQIEAMGPYGNGFPLTDGNAVLIGGGMGLAPMYHLAKTMKKAGCGRVEMYLGFPESTVMEAECRAVCDELFINIGGYVTDDVDFTQNAVYYACGPTPMMKAAAVKAKNAAKTLYISLESRMACGAGACLGCSCATLAGNKRVCKDGPVFLASEVIGYGE